MGDYGILVVACSPKTGEAWIGAYNGSLRRVSPAGELGPPFPVAARSISISPTNGEVWVANGEALVRLDSTGKIVAKFPFEKASPQTWLYAF